MSDRGKQVCVWCLTRITQERQLTLLDAPVVEHRVVRGPDDGGGGRVRVRERGGARARGRQAQSLQRRPRERAE